VISGGPYGFEHLNVAAQRRDANSFLNWLERMCRMRKEVPEIGWGRFKALPYPNPAVLLLRYEWRNNAVLFVHNLDAEPLEITFSEQQSSGRPGVLVNLLSEDHSSADDKGRHRLQLERYGYRWFRVGGLDYLLKRSEV
jgi:maltose alpha-D-glucosyltransferase/alpha-amylase